MEKYILGLDVGVNSIGWATLAQKDGVPSGIIGAGVRIFPEGVEGDYTKGRDEPRNVTRRTARQRRVMLLRRARRMINVAKALQSAGLLPPGDVAHAIDRNKIFTTLDKNLFTKGGIQGPVYQLRARALDEKLTPHEIGRAIYHLSHRRGFQSNRKSSPKKDEKDGEVAQEITTLREKLSRSGARTLGEYLSRLDVANERIRDRWIHREMCKDEFEKIWAAQSAHYPTEMTDPHKKSIFKAIFHQRPLKSMTGKIGECALERGRKRAPWPLLTVQRFRLLQKVNDLQITFTGTGEVRPPTPDERAKIIAALESEGDRTFHQLTKALALPRGGALFNFGKEDDETRMVGNRTAAKMRKVFGEDWDRFPAEKRNQAVEDWLTIDDDKALERRASDHWGLPPEKCREFAKLNLEPGYCALSRKAVEKILPLMEKGIPYATARLEMWPAQKAPQSAFPLLPSMDEAEQKGWMPVVRNPAVRRVLSELRKVVNALVRRDGRPETIRVELARDLKRSRADRREIWKRNEMNRKSRERATQWLEENRIRPTGDAIEKWLLGEECNWHCPYTGEAIDRKTLFSGASPFDVEHIIPFSISLDDSFLNKTLCEANENRKRKKQHTPWEAYGGTPKWNAILEQIEQFRGEAAEQKKRRFLLKEYKPDDFISRQLNDTRYASRLAVQYVGLLYGAGADGVANGQRVVQGGRGQITKYVRDEYSLNRILNDGGTKTRDDHRHHAVDAVAVAVTDPAMVHRLSAAAGRAATERRRRFGKVEAPWPTFSEDARVKILSITPSHQSARKINGPLHEETYYSDPQVDSEGNPCVHRRKAVDSLTSQEVKNIVDPAVRKAVESALKGRTPAEAFKDPSHHPTLQTKSGERIPIHAARVRLWEKTETIGGAGAPRHVFTGSNHHVEVLEVPAKGQGVKWEGMVITRLEAFRRLRRGEPVVRRNHGEGKKFLFSLCGGDVLQLTEDGQMNHFVVRGIGYQHQGGKKYVNVAMVPLTEARLKKDIVAAREWKPKLLEPLRKLSAKKVIITPLGEVRDAND